MNHPILLLVILFFYFVPYLDALSRHKRNSASVLVINAFLGWTVIGWVVALAMAVSPDTPYPSSVDHTSR